MAALLDIVTKDSTNRSVVIRIIDDSGGTPETGVVYNTPGIDLWYRREGAAKTSITEATLAALTTAHADGGFLHIGDGEYRLDLPDAAFATGANYVDVGGAVTGMVVIGGRVRLVDYDLETALQSVNTTQISGSSTAADNAEVVFDTDFATNYNATRNAWATNVQDTVGTGNLPADVVTVSGDGTAADNLELFFDGTGYAAANSTIGTCTTNTDMRGTDSALLATSAPTNFGDLSISVTTGLVSLAADQSGVTVGTVNAMAGTITTLDALDTAQDSQHSTTQGKIDTAQADLDVLTGTDGVTLATTQGNYAPAKAGDNMGTVSAVTGGINTGAGTITTLDGLDTAQDTQHSTTQGKVDTAQADLDLLTGTDGATLATTQPNYAPATSTALATAQTDLDTITGSDGVTLATTQGNYAPAVAGNQMDLVNAPNATAVTAIQNGLATSSALTTVGSNVTAVKAITDALTAAAAAKLATSAGTIVTGTVSNANTSPTTTVFAADDITEATADHFNGRIVIFTSGALQNQATDITDYALDTGEGKFTVTAMTEAPANDDTFVIV